MRLFKANRHLGSQLRAQDAHREGLKKAAGSAAQHAQRFAEAAKAPWMRRRGPQTIVVDDDGQTVRLVNTDHAGHLMEWGSKNNPPHAPLRRGVRAAGLRLTE